MDLADYAREPATSELISSGNYKQALKTVEKRLKRSADDLMTLGLKANLLLQVGDIAGSKTIFARLIGHKPPIVDHLTLELVFSGLCELRRLTGDVDEQEVETLWQNAIKTHQSPRGKIQLAQRWASLSIHHGQWPQLIKATMGLQKYSDQANQAHRNYWYWQTIARYLASHAANPDRIRSVHRDLVLKMLEKAARDTPDSSEIPEKLGLWIATPQELKLLIEILAREGRHRELVNTLEMTKFQKIAETDYAFDLGKSRSLVELDDDMATWKWAKDALEDAMRLHQRWLLDDWRVWSGLIRFARLSNTHDLRFTEDGDVKSALAACEKLVDGCCRPNTISRAPQLAALALLWRKAYLDYLKRNNADNLFPERDSLDKFTICESHFKRYFDQIFVFDDLQDKLAILSSNELAPFRQHVVSYVRNKAPKPQTPERNQVAWIIAETNALRMDYEILQRRLRESEQNPRSALLSVFEGHILSCLQLYRVSRMQNAQLPATAVKHGDYSSVLAVKALRLLYSEHQIARTSFQALCLLESLVVNSESNFKARIEHVNLLTDLGLHLSAWESFRGLEVKEILSESLSPLFFARIATMNPYSSGGFDAREAMEKPLEFYARAITKIPKYQELALDSQNYAQVIHMEELARRIRDSATRWMLGLERRRIARIRGLQYDHMDSLLDPLKCPKTVNFHNLSLKSRGYAESKLHHGGCEPYIEYLGFVDSLSEAVNALVESQRAKQPIELLRDLHLKLTLPTNSSPHVVEFEMIPFLNALASLVEAAGRAKTDLSTITERVEFVADMMNHCWQDKDIFYWRSHCEEHVVPLGIFYNSCYNGLEFLQMCYKVADKIVVFVNSTKSREMPKQRKQCLEGARRIQATAKDRASSVLMAARQARGQLPPRDRIVEIFFGVAENKDDSDIGKVILDIVGYNNARSMLISYIEAARKSLDGILRVKVG